MKTKLRKKCIDLILINYKISTGWFRNFKPDKEIIILLIKKTLSHSDFIKIAGNKPVSSPPQPRESFQGRNSVLTRE